MYSDFQVFLHCYGSTNINGILVVPIKLRTGCTSSIWTSSFLYLGVIILFLSLPVVLSSLLLCIGHHGVKERMICGAVSTWCPTVSFLWGSHYESISQKSYLVLSIGHVRSRRRSVMLGRQRFGQEAESIDKIDKSRLWNCRHSH